MVEVEQHEWCVEAVGTGSRTAEMIEKNSSGGLVQRAIARGSTFQIITWSHPTDR